MSRTFGVRLNVVMMACVVTAGTPVANAQEWLCVSEAPQPENDARYHEALRQYEQHQRNINRESNHPDPTELNEALNAAVAMCQAGNDVGIRSAAWVYWRLGNVLQGSLALDTYLARHHGGSQDSRYSIVLADLRSQLLAAVAWVRLETSLRDVTFGIPGSLDRDHERTRFVAPGPVTVTVGAPGYHRVERLITFGPGEQRLIVDGRDHPITGVGDAHLNEQRITLIPIEAPHEAPPPLVAPSPPATPLTPPTPSPAIEPIPVQTPHSLRPWWITSTVASGAFAVLGSAFVIAHESRVSTYSEHRCGTSLGDGACATLYQDIGTLSALSITSFALAGASLAGTLALYLVDSRTPARHASAAGCALSLPSGVRCTF